MIFHLLIEALIVLNGVLSNGLALAGRNFQIDYIINLSQSTI